MNNAIDARGLSCPQPVLMTIDRMKNQKNGEIIVLVDTETARENVTRAAGNLGWDLVNVQAEEMDFKMTLKKE